MQEKIQEILYSRYAKETKISPIETHGFYRGQKICIAHYPPRVTAPEAGVDVVAPEMFCWFCVADSAVVVDVEEIAPLDGISMIGENGSREAPFEPLWSHPIINPVAVIKPNIILLNSCNVHVCK